MGRKIGSMLHCTRRCKKRALIGVLCILSGILVMVCFVPGWLVAIIVAFMLFSIGAGLIGCR